MTTTDLLTRQFAIERNTDPFGIKWGIGKVNGTALYHIDILEGNKNKVKPSELDGWFTNSTLAQKAIELYLLKLWDANDVIVEKQKRKEHKENL